MVYLSVVELLFWVRSLSFKTKKQNCSLFSFSFSVYDHGQLRPRFQAESLKSWLMNFSWEILEWSSICIRLVNAEYKFLIILNENIRNENSVLLFLLMFLRPPRLIGYGATKRSVSNIICVLVCVQFQPLYISFRMKIIRYLCKI